MLTQDDQMFDYKFAMTRYLLSYNQLGWHMFTQECQH